MSVVDTNGDGRDELISLCPTHDKSRPEHSYDVFGYAELPVHHPRPVMAVIGTITVNGASVSKPRPFLVDVNGDGLKDLFECAPTEGDEGRGSAWYFAGRRGDGPAFDTERSGIISSSEMRGACGDYTYYKRDHAFP